MRCWWKVRVWDRDAEASEWSEPTCWTMGLLGKAAWSGAKRIASPRGIPRKLLAKSTRGVRMEDKCPPQHHRQRACACFESLPGNRERNGPQEGQGGRISSFQRRLRCLWHWIKDLQIPICTPVVRPGNGISGLSGVARTCGKRYPVEVCKNDNVVRPPFLW